MSRRAETRYAAKRRAANRKRFRDIVRYIAIFGFIGIVIVGTVSIAFVSNSPTIAVSPTPTATVNGSLGSLVTQGDAAIASGDYTGGISYYLAYSSQNSSDADVLFKIGQAYVDPKNPNPDYLAGVAYLQRALSANSSATWASQASALMTQYEPQAEAEATTTAVAAAKATQVVTGTSTITSTTTVTGTGAAPGSAGAPVTGVTPTTRVPK